MCALTPTTQAFENSENSLEALVVTASKYPSEIFKTPGFITVLTQEDIQQSGVRSVNEAIVKLGGLVGRPSLYGGNEWTLDVMGFGEAAASNMVFVIDGVTYKESDQSEVRIGNIQLEEVERIEIQKGGSSVLYGDGAVSGVVNIVTRSSGWNSKTQTQGSLQTGVGSYGAAELKFSTSKSLPGLLLTASGAHLKSDGFRENSASHGNNVQLGIQHFQDDFRMGVHMANENQYAQTPGSLTEAQYFTDRGLANELNKSSKTFNDLQTTNYGVFVEKNFDGLIARIDLKQREKDYFFRDQKGGAESSAYFITMNQNYGLNLRQMVKFESGSADFIMGAESNNWVQDRVTQDFGTYHNLSNSQATYFKVNANLNAIDTMIGVGTRNESMNRSSVGFKNSEYYATASHLQAWEVSAVKTMNAENSFWAKWGTNYRLPNIDEISNAYSDNTYAVLNLKPQTSLDRELGWHLKMIHTNARLRIFQNTYKNEIVFDRAAYLDPGDPTPFTGYAAYYIGSNVNLEATMRQGLDAGFNHEFSSQFSLGATATYQQSKFTTGVFDGRSLPLSPQTIFSLRSSWKLDSKQSIGLNLQHVGQQYIGSDFANQFTMPAYVNTDLRYGYKESAWELSIFIRNIFNKDYYSFATNTYTDLIRSTALYPEMKRSVFFNFKYLL